MAEKLNAEKLEHIEDILREFKEEARKAEQSNDIFTLSVYNTLLKAMSPIVTRAYARIEREGNAEINKAERALRKSAKTQQSSHA